MKQRIERLLENSGLPMRKCSNLTATWKEEPVRGYILA